MSNSARFAPRLGCLTAVLSVLLAQGSLDARAEDFSVADLVGDQAFVESFESHTPLKSSFHEGHATHPGALVGRFSFDGLGNVAGSRTWSRSYVSHGGFAWPTLITSTVEQSFTGTYEVSADGRGIMEIAVDHNPPWEASGFVHVNFPQPTEVIRFSLADGGRRLLLVHEIAGRHFSPAAPDDRLWWTEANLIAKGTSETQEPQDSSAVAEAIAILKAQNCEILRLLNQPQGRRSTDASEVIEACGRGYSWPE